MAESVRVQMGWALRGKPPGSLDDYSILAVSKASFSREDFTTILAWFMPGTPPNRHDGPGALPWVSVNWAGVGQDLHLGIAIHQATDQVDRDRRPITQTSYFCVPYTVLAETPVSYSSLYQAVAPVQLPHQDGELMLVELPTLEPEDLARQIEEVGETAAATAAALLLGGPVDVVQAEASTLAERLSFLDAVAAMLPYGYRTGLAAATWSDSGTRHHIRLAFATRPREGAAEMPWRAAGEVQVSKGPGGTYLDQLDQLRGRSPGRRRVFSLPALIAHLARDTEPRKFDQPQYAVDYLRDMDLPFVVLAAVQQGRADPREVRQLFAQSRITELPPEGQLAVLEQLLGYGDTNDLQAIGQWWQQIVGNSANDLLPTFATVCRQLLWAASPKRELLQEYLVLARQTELEDPLFARLLARPDAAAEWPAALAYAAQLVRERVLAVGATREHPLTLETLAGSPALVCELLAQLANAHQDATEAIHWLAPAVPGLLPPFAIVLTGTAGEVSAQAIAQLAFQGTGCVGALLQAALQTNRLDRVLPGFVTWLCAQGALDPQERRHWYDLAWHMSPGDPVSRAWLDLGLLALAERPRFLLQQAVAGQTDWSAYCRCFTRAWLNLSRTQARFDDEQFTVTLARHLTEQEQVWAKEEGVAASIVEITKPLTQSGQRRVLLAAVATSLNAVPDATRWKFARKWLAQVVREDPEILRVGTLIALRSLPPASSSEKIARLCIRSLKEGIPATDGGAALAKSGAIDSASAAIALLAALRREVQTTGGPEHMAEEVPRWYSGMFASGVFGEQIGAAFRELMPRVASAEIWHQLRLLYETACGGRGQPPKLKEEDRHGLEEIEKVVSQILRETRKTWGFPSLTRGSGREPGEAQPGSGVQPGQEA
jgi:hypothetical protein